MRVVITGSSGLVGRALVQLALSSTAHSLVLVDLAEPAEKLDNPRVEYRQADLLSYPAFLALLTESGPGGEKVGGLVHLAGLPNPRDWDGWRVHNTNVCLSFNALAAAAEAGVEKVVMASSVNAIGGAWSPGEPQYQYFPIDELHPCTPSDPYSLSKQVLELQAQSVARANPRMSITCLRLHAVLPAERKFGKEEAARGRKDLWGWTDPEEAGRACLLGLEVGWSGAEEVFVVMRAHRCEGWKARGLRETFWPGVPWRDGEQEREGFYDCSKAETVLGWKEPRGEEVG